MGSLIIGMAVCDGNNHRVQVFRYSDGTHLRSIGSSGSGNGQFNEPWSIAFDGAGYIIVSESSGCRVQVLRYSDSAHVCTIAIQGTCNGKFSYQFSYASGIAVDGRATLLSLTAATLVCKCFG